MPQLHLTVKNGQPVIIPLICTGIVETCPPYYEYEPIGNYRFDWVPTQTTTESTFRWTDPDPIPSILVTPLGPSLHCQLKNGDDLLYDYGSEVYYSRNWLGCCMGTNSQNIDLLKVYVGRPVNCAGSESQSVVFKMDKGQLSLVNLEYRASP